MRYLCQHNSEIHLARDRNATKIVLAICVPTLRRLHHRHSGGSFRQHELKPNAHALRKHFKPKTTSCGARSGSPREHHVETGRALPAGRKKQFALSACCSRRRPPRLSRRCERDGNTWLFDPEQLNDLSLSSPRGFAARGRVAMPTQRPRNRPCTGSRLLAPLRCAPAILR